MGAFNSFNWRGLGFWHHPFPLWYLDRDACMWTFPRVKIPWRLPSNESATVSGFRLIGFNFIFSSILTVPTNGFLSYPTLPVSFCLFGSFPFHWNSTINHSPALINLNFACCRGGYLLHFFQYTYITYINLSTEVTPELTTLREGEAMDVWSLSSNLMFSVQLLM